MPKEIEVGYGNYLTEYMGWILLHNPTRGMAIPTKGKIRKYTKAQAEFLYDYYIKRDLTKQANQIWNEYSK